MISRPCSRSNRPASLSASHRTPRYSPFPSPLCPAHSPPHPQVVPLAPRVVPPPRRSPRPRPPHPRLLPRLPPQFLHEGLVPDLRRAHRGLHAPRRPQLPH